MHRYLTLLAVLTLALSGCAQVPGTLAEGSDRRAMDLLEGAAEAHGVPALSAMRDVSVRFEGEWSPFIGRIQPKLVDGKFRGISEERFLLSEPAVGQTHVGPGGTKYVFRSAAETRVWYNGRESDDPQARDAAALVADNYRMFLLGPRFFLERNATVQYLGAEQVDGFQCDNVLATLTPGAGNCPEDRVVISIDRDRRWFRRLRLTVNGLKSTRGAVVDVFLRDHVKFQGVLLPTSFFEELKRPFPLSVHRWRLTGLDFNRGLDEGAIKGPAFAGPATRRAGSSPTTAEVTSRTGGPAK